MSPCSAIVNLEYEYDLAQAPLSLEERNKRRREFEFIFFFINQDPQKSLIAHQKYPADYLNYLKKLGLHPQIASTSAAADELWWGKLSPIELQQKLNSKLTSFAVAKKNHLCPIEVSQVSSLAQIEALLAQSSANTFILRSSFNFSGQGIIRFDRQYFSGQAALIAKALEKGPLIISPWFNRVLDLSARFTSQETLTYLNFVDPHGHYKGGLVSADLDGYLKEHFPQLLSCYEEWKEKIPVVKKAYQELGAQDDFGMDSFIYQSEEGPKLYALCEVNYRRTMGSMTHALKPFLPEGNCQGLWVILRPQNPPKNFTALCEGLGADLYDPHTRLGVIPTSPVGNRFLSFFLSYPDSSLLRRKENWLRLWLEKRV